MLVLSQIFFNGLEGKMVSICAQYVRSSWGVDTDLTNTASYELRETFLDAT